MLQLEGINYWAILVVWIINMIIGAWWYSPVGFGKRWTKLSGVDHMKIPEKEATRIIGYVAVSALAQVSVLATVFNSLGISSIKDGLVAAIVLWLGFTAATTVGNTLYMRKSWKFWWLNGSYYLLVFLLGALVLVALN